MKQGIRVRSLRPEGTGEWILRILLTLLVMTAPLLVTLIMTVPRGIDPFSALPVWNDENWWYLQYGAISAYGRPLGYFGYAGTHAYVGTWGPWGMFPLLLTGVFAAVFGWQLHTYVYLNYLFLALSALVFILLTRPSVRSLVCLAAANAVSWLVICYSVVCMNEVVRYSVALVLAGILYRVIRYPDCSRVRFVLRCTVVPLLLAYAAMFYTILGAFIPLYLYLMLRKLKPGWRILITVPVSAAAIYLLRSANSYTAAPYITGAAASVSKALSSDLSFRIQNLFYSLIGNAQNIDLFYLLTHAEETSEYPMLLWFCVLLYAMIGFLIRQVIVHARKPEKREVFLTDACALFLLCAFLGGHIVMYNTTSWTFMRGCCAAVYCAFMLCALHPKEDAHTWRAALIISIAGVFTFAAVFVSVFTAAGRFSTPEKDALRKAQRAELGEILALDSDADDPWENTVVLCGTDDEIYYILPFGVGVNGAVDDVINRDAKYVIVGRDFAEEETRLARLQTLEDAGHVVIAESDEYTILMNAAKYD